MFIRRTVIAAALIAAPIAFAASAQAAPCSYFGNDPSGPDKSICGVPDLNDSIQHAKENLEANFSVDKAAENFKHNLTNGVGSEDSAE